MFRYWTSTDVKMWTIWHLNVKKPSILVYTHPLITADWLKKRNKCALFYTRKTLFHFQYLAIAKTDLIWISYRRSSFTVRWLILTRFQEPLIYLIFCRVRTWEYECIANSSENRVRKVCFWALPSIGAPRTKDTQGPTRLCRLCWNCWGNGILLLMCYCSTIRVLRDPKQFWNNADSFTLQTSSGACE